MEIIKQQQFFFISFSFIYGNLVMLHPSLMALRDGCFISCSVPGKCLRSGCIIYSNTQEKRKERKKTGKDGER